jgi:2-keto-3-deoxy-L-rhamnonate aldolase RhmA
MSKDCHRAGSKSNFVSLRRKLHAGVPVIGTFVKTPAHALVEIFGVAGIDFVILDSEHAPLGLTEIDRLVLAARGADLPCLVRVADTAAIGPCLDLGAAGVVVPHVASEGAARASLAAAKFSINSRGFSPSTRANAYGTGPTTYRNDADLTSMVWCQIEDASALDQIDSIAALADIDCLFIGRADLACSFNVQSINDPLINAAIERTVAAARLNHRPVGIYVNDLAEVANLLERGITIFVCGSDQGMLLASAQRLRREVDAVGSSRGRR